MITIHLISLGKLKESYWREAEAEYAKRLQSFAKLVVHELKEESFGDKDKPEEVKMREAKKITIEIEKIKPDYTIVLDEHGKQISSTELATHISNETMKQCNSFCFIIGGPLGLDPSIPKLGNLTLSLSLFTFTHQMARVFLIEQLYRAMMIAHNRTYHY